MIRDPDDCDRSLSIGRPLLFMNIQPEMMRPASPMSVVISGRISVDDVPLDHRAIWEDDRQAEFPGDH
jgi:hypothetical protein